MHAAHAVRMHGGVLVRLLGLLEGRQGLGRLARFEESLGEHHVQLGRLLEHFLAELGVEAELLGRLERHDHLAEGVRGVLVALGQEVQPPHFHLQHDVGRRFLRLVQLLRLFIQLERPFEVSLLGQVYAQPP